MQVLQRAPTAKGWRVEGKRRERMLESARFRGVKNQRQISFEIRGTAKSVEAPASPTPDIVAAVTVGLPYNY